MIFFREIQNISKMKKDSRWLKRTRYELSYLWRLKFSELLDRVVYDDYDQNKNVALYRDTFHYKSSEFEVARNIRETSQDD